MPLLNILCVFMHPAVLPATALAAPDHKYQLPRRYESVWNRRHFVSLTVQTIHLLECRYLHGDLDSPVLVKDQLIDRVIIRVFSHDNVIKL